jgi:two-component system, sensor histidine kinase and response regulator
MSNPTPIRILVVDDEPAHRETTALALTRHGYEVQTASQGRAALALARSFRPALILSDVVMPEVDGYLLTSLLKRDSELASIPVILMTGEANLVGLRRGMSLGADDYLPKPFKVEDLLDAVRIRLEKQERWQHEAEARMESLRGSIAMMLPHELRTPLVGILGIADLLELSPGSMPRDELARFASLLRQSGERLLHLTERFLTYAQLELLAGDPAALDSLRTLPALDQAETIRQRARAQAEIAKRPGDLRLEVTETRWPMSPADAARVADELIENAFKFSEPGSPVTVRTDRVEAGTWLVIIDGGRGFKPDDTTLIGAFTQFNRRTHEQQGTGLGLVIAKRLVEAHGGELALESAPGQGTTIRLRFP